MADKKKILIADDMDTFLRLEKMLLEHSGYEIIMAKSGAEALKKIQTEHPDMVFLDMMMPDITGDTVCRFVKTNKALMSIPVVMVTTKSEPDYVDRCKKAGCDDYLNKPITKRDLIETINKFLKKE
jgi:CheY-like chemotaxis protein